MWKLLRFLKPYRKESICAPLFKLLEVIFELLVPLVVAAMIDNGIGGNDRGELLRSAALMITLGAVGLASATPHSTSLQKHLPDSVPIFDMP